MQRAIAEELNLSHVMPIFDKQDEEDDFRGVDDSSRKVIPWIGSLINKSLRDEIFLMIFNYGGVEDIDLIECGIPVFGKDYILLPQMIELMTNLRELNIKGVSWKTASHSWKKLQKLHKLRLTESSDVVMVDNCSSVDMMNLELLDLSGNTHLESLPTLSSARSLKMLVLDGCSSLEQIALQGAPPLLEHFSFDGYGPAEEWTHHICLPQKILRPKSPIAPDEIVKVTKISLDGFPRLHNIFLRALPNLEELDLSGTAIKILELGAEDVPNLKKLFLLGCEQLRSLIWHGSSSLEVLHVDTRGKIRSMICCGEQGSFDTEVCIAFTDGRHGDYGSFASIRTFSASDLLVAYCIWGRGINTWGSTRCFKQLEHIYLYNCPRLVFVLPISFTLPNLETLQIAYCNSLRHVFPLDDEYPESIASGVTFENLKHIKLYHIHNLEQICEARLTAPALQTIGLRDCWGLRRLPAVAREGPKPLVDCEKDWWNRLEWDGLDAGHHPSFFKTRHSAYYKKTLPRVSYLRSAAH
ncbi:hypothetical protein D1007_57599 [Hordeum vulgare]|nr:hypothetical protein D1007_57599 [Hordeum vulgare]